MRRFCFVIPRATLRRMRGMGVVPRMLDAVFFWVCENSRFRSIGVRIGVWKWLDACESSYSVKWRRYCDRYSIS